MRFAGTRHFAFQKVKESRAAFSIWAIRGLYL
jgi:hypothetical protein